MIKLPYRLTIIHTMLSALLEEWRNSGTRGHLRPNSNLPEDTRGAPFLCRSFFGFAPQHCLQCYSTCSAAAVEARVSCSLAKEQQAIQLIRFPWLPSCSYLLIKMFIPCIGTLGPRTRIKDSSFSNCTLLDAKQQSQDSAFLFRHRP